MGEEKYEAIVSSRRERLFVAVAALLVLAVIAFALLTQRVGSPF
ncbi:MAG TPA: hypothetical protein VFN63_03850 [Pseudolabrys sp.]|nr:hypothetical protein [Pseudolabrys sp.]